MLFAPHTFTAATSHTNTHTKPTRYPAVPALAKPAGPHLTAAARGLSTLSAGCASHGSMGMPLTIAPFPPTHTHTHLVLAFRSVFTTHLCRVVAACTASLCRRRLDACRQTFAHSTIVGRSLYCALRLAPTEPFLPSPSFYTIASRFPLAWFDCFIPPLPSPHHSQGQGHLRL